MENREQLALSYLEAYPGESAQVLLSLPVKAVAELFTNTAPEVIARVASHLSAGDIAQYAVTMDADSFTPIVDHLPPSLGAATLRLLSKENRSQILKLMPPKSRHPVETLLKFNPEKIGAWVDTQIFTVSDRVTVREARRALKKTMLSIPNRIFVLDQHQRVVGAILAGDLLRASGPTLITSLTLKIIPTLMANSPITQARQHSNWQQHIEMPVVNKNKQFIGILSLNNLSNADNIGHHNAKLSQQTEAETANFTQVFADALTGMWQLSVDLFGSAESKVKRQHPEHPEHENLTINNPNKRSKT